jgi:aconitate hydratase
LITLYNQKTALVNGDRLVPDISLEKVNYALAEAGLPAVTPQEIEKGKENTLAWSILTAHNTSKDPKQLKLKFDALASHDITYVGIIQTARASGLKEFPVPYVLTNCHNSLCAVGGTINEDDHLFGLSAAKKYGGVFVPAHLAVIHQYMREMYSGCGRMILGSDSHTRYGALGTMAIGEGGPELVKQLLNRTYDIAYPDTVCVYLENEPKKGVGPHDVALAIIGEVFKNGFVKNSVMEFTGPGVAGLSVDFRNGIDVMTTETACLSSIWVTDQKVYEYLKAHGRENAFRVLKPGDVAVYDRAIRVDLSKMEPMIALPFHPSNTYTIKEFLKNAPDLLAEIDEEVKRKNPEIDVALKDLYKDGKVTVNQGIIAGCSGGTFENICAAADVLDGKSVGTDEFVLSVYPQSQPVFYELNRNGSVNKLMAAGAVIKTAFCGPCFGAGDVPANNSLSIRHTTRNFPNREGSKPGDGQIAAVALMDARSIAATALNHGVITPATEIDFPDKEYPYTFSGEIYKNRVYNGYKKADPSVSLRLGPNIKDWPEMEPLKEHLLLKVASFIDDPVTTTDELIPSGETSSYRSNPIKLAEFALGRVDPGYVKRAKEIARLNQNKGQAEELKQLPFDLDLDNTVLGSVIYANKPGDGSAREQAASVQKVLGGYANIALEYATKRYRSNLVNWGLLPFIVSEKPSFKVGDYIYIEGIRSGILQGKREFDAVVISGGEKSVLKLKLPGLTDGERDILLEGSLINYYKSGK